MADLLFLALGIGAFIPFDGFPADLLWTAGAIGVGAVLLMIRHRTAAGLRPAPPRRIPCEGGQP